MGFRSLTGPINSGVLVFNYGYRMSPKWLSTFGTTVDLYESRNIGQNFSLTRIGESFLMSVIAIAGAAVRSLPELVSASPDDFSALAIGTGAALFSGIAAIWLFVRLLRGRVFYRFAYYVWAVGALFLIWLAAS